MSDGIFVIISFSYLYKDCFDTFISFTARQEAEGYYIESVYEGVDIFGYLYQKTVIVKIEPGKKRRREDEEQVYKG